MYDMVSKSVRKLTSSLKIFSVFNFDDQIKIFGHYKIAFLLDNVFEYRFTNEILLILMIDKFDK